jgi:hypothetical protein
VARDDLDHTVRRRFDTPCLGPIPTPISIAPLRRGKDRLASCSQTRLDSPTALTSVRVQLGQCLEVWEYGANPPDFSPHGATSLLALSTEMPWGPWIGWTKTGRPPAATTWMWRALRAGDAVMHMMPDCSSTATCARTAFDIQVHVSS